MTDLETECLHAQFSRHGQQVSDVPNKCDLIFLFKYVMMEWFLYVGSDHRAMATLLNIGVCSSTYISARLHMTNFRSAIL